ncbi:MAG: 23S rRNA (uracil(1939)-C(5))-methyltransferase RlmD [Clostridia bacterium]|nr:23S rRNA (uracil(1939)-C(5))-methyltransferase RlmD [Clostridia bacterium]
MLKKNEEYIVEIIDNGFQGEGISKIDGITVFIPNAIKGERIKIKIVKVQTNFAYGKILEIIEKSKNRQQEDCITYSKCGGCNLRHIKYEETLNIKKSIVENCMYKALKKEIKVNNVIGMKPPFYYRNKLQYPLGFIDNKRVMGIYSERSHNIIATTKCMIQNELCQAIANYAFEYIQENKIKVYDENDGTGTIRHIIVRIGVKTNEVLLTLVVNDNRFKDYVEDFTQYMIIKFPEIKAIVLNYNQENTNVILGKKCETLYGRGYIYDILGEYKFKISPLSFYQINPIQTEILYNTAIEFVGKDESRSLQNQIALDLYCGIGTIGIFASKYFKKVYGIEIVEEAIEDAKENAKMNNIENIEFYAGDVEELLPKIIVKEKIKPNIVFVDPPRKGLDNNTVELLKNLEPEKIIYISCNPATLARDLSNMEEKYEIKEVQPVDMFPYTSHVECVCLLKLKESTEK